MQTGNTDFVYRNELDKACFQHKVAYGKSKDLTRRTQSDKALKDKAFKSARNRKYDGYQRGLASMVYKFFQRKSGGSDVASEPNYQLANELHRKIIRKFKRQKAYSSFRDSIGDVDLANIQSLSKYNRGIKHLVSAIYLFSRYVWVFPLKEKRKITIRNAFQKIISKGLKPKKIWVDQCAEVYRNLLERFLKINSLKCIQHTVKENPL